METPLHHDSRSAGADDCLVGGDSDRDSASGAPHGDAAAVLAAPNPLALHPLADLNFDQVLDLALARLREMAGRPVAPTPKPFQITLVPIPPRRR